MAAVEGNPNFTTRYVSESSSWQMSEEILPSAWHQHT